MKWRKNRQCSNRTGVMWSARRQCESRGRVERSHSGVEANGAHDRETPPLLGEK